MARLSVFVDIVDLGGGTVAPGEPARPCAQAVSLPTRRALSDGARRNVGFGEGGQSIILDDKLAAGDVIVLDGAIGSEIDRIGGKMDQAAWCGLANLTDPDTVRRVHESYLEAGADVITATAL